MSDIKRMTLHKKYQELELSNNFIFQKYMKNEENCKKVISEILGREVERIEYPTVERFIKERVDSKGVRLDVYFKGDDEIYNIEMQTADKKNIDKRSRYYHSIIDIENANEGIAYNSLVDTYVVFICTFDPFGENEYKYTFKNTCLENPDTNFDDGNTTIVVNTKGVNGNISDDLKTFLNALEGVFSSNDYSVKIKEEVDRIKMLNVYEEEYMFEELHRAEMEAEAREKGMKEGLEEGRIVGIEEGKKVGIEEGRKEGIEEGKKVGIEEGRKEGLKEGEILLVKKLLLNNSKEDLIKMGIEEALIEQALES